MRKNNVIALAAAIIISQLAGIIGSFFTAPAIDSWYQFLSKPELAPPDWIFAPVWITLFSMMGVAAFLIWKQGWEKKEVKIALGIFGLQLILNTTWSILFFGLQAPLIAFIEIIFLWIAILATIITFYRISTPAAGLLVPYILWVSFAGYLNLMIWLLN